MPSPRQRRRNLGMPEIPLHPSPLELPDTDPLKAVLAAAMDAQKELAADRVVLQKAIALLTGARITGDAKSVRRAEDNVQDQRAALVMAEQAADMARDELEREIGKRAPELERDSRARTAEIQREVNQPGRLMTLTLNDVDSLAGRLSGERVFRAWVASAGESVRPTEPPHPLAALATDWSTAITRYMRAREPAAPARLGGPDVVHHNEQIRAGVYPPAVGIDGQPIRAQQ